MIPGLGTKLRRLTAELDGGVQEIYDRAGIGFRPRFYPMARLLSASGPAGIGALARSAGVSQPAATQTVNEMKRLGLVEIEPGLDRRERHVRLTSKGQEVVRELEPVWEAAHRAAAALEVELSISLGAALDGALAALDDRSFSARIDDELGDRQ